MRWQCLKLIGAGQPSSSIYARYVCLERFSFLILIGRFVTLEP